MYEYASLNHMSFMTTCSGTFLPYHAVWKTNPKPKLRVVYDASHTSESGKSLNDCLLAGPKLQTDLWTIVIRARFFKILFTADIAKMYRKFLLTLVIQTEKISLVLVSS